jgi:hypothetical protein
MTRRINRLTPRSASTGLITVRFLVVVYLLVGPAASPQAPPPRTPASTVVTGEVAWGKTFEREIGRNLALRVELLGGPKSGQDGIYVSVLNKSNPKHPQFVLLPELINGSESNFIGAFAPAGADPKEVSEELKTALESIRHSGLELTYFTDTLNRAQLQGVEDANLTLGHHGEPDEVYEKAQKVLDRLQKTTGLFKVLDYRLGRDPGTPGALRINYLKFSFEVSAQRPSGS